MRIVAGVEDLLQRTGDGQTQFEYLVAGRSGGRVIPCAVCTVHIETRSVSFLIEPQNQGRRVSQFGPQNRQLWFGDLSLKIITTVSWFRPQNQAGYGLSVAPQNQWENDSVWGTRQDLVAYFSWKQVTLEFFSLTSRLTEKWWRVVHMASSQRLCRVEVEDGWVDATVCVGPFYPKIIIFSVLDPRGNLYFCLGL
jgi:hypothetical protein